MRFFLPDTITGRVPGWNQRIYGAEAAAELANNLRVGVVECDLQARGEYFLHGGQPIIAIRQGLGQGLRLWVILHEIGHHLLHAPVPHKFSPSITQKQDAEANFFAAVALMPGWLCSGSTPAEIAAAFDYPAEIIEIRRQISELFKI